MSERESMCRIVKNLADGINHTVLELDRTWKMYASLHLKRCRLAHEAEMLAASLGGAKGVHELGEENALRSRIESLNEEAKSVRGDLDKLDEELTRLGSQRDDFIQYLRDIESTFQSLIPQATSVA